MDQSPSTIAQQLAQAALACSWRRTGHAPQSATVVLSGETLVIMLHSALSPAERTLSRSGPEGAAQVLEFHHQLFVTSTDTLRQEIQRITGVEVREAAADVEPHTGAAVQALASGAVVQVFLLAGSVPPDSWCEGTTGAPS